APRKTASTSVPYLPNFRIAGRTAKRLKAARLNVTRFLMREHTRYVATPTSGSTPETKRARNSCSKQTMRPRKFLKSPTVTSRWLSPHGEKLKHHSARRH